MKSITYPLKLTELNRADREGPSPLSHYHK